MLFKLVCLVRMASFQEIDSVLVSILVVYPHHLGLLLPIACPNLEVAMCVSTANKTTEKQIRPAVYRIMHPLA